MGKYVFAWILGVPAVVLVGIRLGSRISDRERDGLPAIMSGNAASELLPKGA